MTRPLNAITQSTIPISFTHFPFEFSHPSLSSHPSLPFKSVIFPPSRLITFALREVRWKSERNGRGQWERWWVEADMMSPSIVTVHPITTFAPSHYFFVSLHRACFSAFLFNSKNISMASIIFSTRQGCPQLSSVCTNPTPESEPQCG